MGTTRYPLKPRLFRSALEKSCQIFPVSQFVVRARQSLVPMVLVSLSTPNGLR